MFSVKRSLPNSRGHPTTPSSDATHIFETVWYLLPEIHFEWKRVVTMHYVGILNAIYISCKMPYVCYITW